MLDSTDTLRIGKKQKEQREQKIRYEEGVLA
jgi:hypothetical protein